MCEKMMCNCVYFNPDCQKLFVLFLFFFIIDVTGTVLKIEQPWNKSEDDEDTKLVIKHIHFDQHQRTECKNIIISWLSCSAGAQYFHRATSQTQA